MFSPKDAKLRDDLLFCTCLLCLNSLNIGSFLTETVLRRFGLLLPSLCGELAGERLPRDLPITMDLGEAASVDTGCTLKCSSVRAFLLRLNQLQ